MFVTASWGRSIVPLYGQKASEGILHSTLFKEEDRVQVRDLMIRFQPSRYGPSMGIYSECIHVSKERKRTVSSSDYHKMLRSLLSRDFA